MPPFGNWFVFGKQLTLRLVGGDGYRHGILLHVFAAFAELEREMIRECVVSGLRTAKTSGKRLGRPRKVFRRDEAFALRSEGMSWRKISKLLNVPMSTVIDACRSENPSSSKA